MAASPKEQFEAAVNIIQSLPKNGSFQPSHALMLTFYGYYKQATLGKCNIRKPSFWDVINKTKWEAWNKLGDMPREQAMLNYVEELKKVTLMLTKDKEFQEKARQQTLKQSDLGHKSDPHQIVEVMPHTQPVADFMEKLGHFYELVDERMPFDPREVPGCENMPAQENGDAKRIPEVAKVNGDITGLPLEEEEEEQERSLSQTTKPEVSNGHVEEILPSTIKSAAKPRIKMNGRVGGAASIGSESDSEGEEFCDTSDLPEQSGLAGYEDHNDMDHGNTSTETSQVYLYNLTHSSIKGHAEPDTDRLDDPPRSNGFHCDADTSDNIMLPSLVPASQDAEGYTYTSDYNTDDLVGQSALNQDLPGLNSYGSIGDAMTCRGGGDSQERESRGGAMPRQGSAASLSSQGRGAASGGSSASRRGLHGPAGGAGGGGQDPRSFGPAGGGHVNEHIAIALVRLQQDMNSVLARLNTLESLTVAQHQMSRNKQEEDSVGEIRGSSWWPFGRLSGKTIAFMLVWPFIVHWIIRVMGNRAKRWRKC